MSGVTIFHNPSCGTSRNTLALIRDAGIEPTVIEYLNVGWTAPQLRDLFQAAGISAQDALRVRGTDAAERGLTGPNVSHDAVIAAMVENPALVERPFVQTSKGAVLARPKELALDLLQTTTGIPKRDGASAT